jgi:hypothetical protein
MSLIERGGAVRSFHVPEVNAETLRPIVVAQISRSSSLMTNSAPTSLWIGKEFSRHQVVNHRIGEYVRSEAHINTVEGYFSILKSGLIGTYHHVSQQHLKRYVAEFDFRYNDRAKLGVSDRYGAHRESRSRHRRQEAYLSADW